MTNTEDEFGKLLNTLKFDALQRRLMDKTFEEMEGILYGLAYNPPHNHGNLLVYTFMQKLLLEHETWQLHASMSRLLGSILNHINVAAESIGLYHGLRALDLNPDDIDLMEFILYFNAIPEKVLSDDDASALKTKIAISKSKAQKS